MAEDKQKPQKKVEESKKQPEKKQPKKQEPKKIKPYVHIDTFLQTAIHVYGLSSIQAQGFKHRMNGKHYQRDEQVFVKELKKYLNIK